MRHLVIAAVAVTMMGGCPLLAQLFDAPATLVINNQSSTAAIDEVRLKGPNDGSFGPNVLEGTIASGASASLLVEVPSTSQGNGVMNSSAEYEVKVVYCCSIDLSGNNESEVQMVTLVEGESASATFGDECAVGSCP